MGEATQTQTQYSLLNPPPGAKFVFEEVRTDRGNTSLGQVPILEWGDDEASVRAAIDYYGFEGIANILNGTSLKVSFQSIARRLKTRVVKNVATPATDEEIAKAQIEFRPGKREGGQSTPASRAANEAKKAAAMANGDALAQLFKKVQNREIPASVLEALGIDPSTFYTPAPSENGVDAEVEVAGE